MANHSASNRTFYCDFLAQPVQSDNAYNADTNTEDVIINTIHDPEQQIHLWWEGAWGAVQAISNEFQIVLSSEHANVIRTIPRSGNVEREIFVGLILQYHYVGLVVPNNVARICNSEDVTLDNTDDPLSDA